MPFPLVPALGALAVSMSGFLGFRNTNKSTATSKELAKKQQEHQLMLAELNIQAQRNFEEDRQAFQERMAALGFAQQLTLREYEHEFQMRLRQLDHQQQREVEEFRATVSAVINQKNLDFQAWKFQQEIKLQFSIAAFQRETALTSIEANRILDNWPLNIFPSQILKSHPDHLRIFISPPSLEYDRAINFTDPNKRNNFSKIENFLGSSLLNLLNQHYPRNDAARPTQLLDGAWDTGRYKGNASIVALASCLESEPFIVLETKVTLNRYISLMVAYKAPGQNNYFYGEIVPRFDYADILRTSAKVNNNQEPMMEDWEILYGFLETAHCIVSAWMVDVHHLLYYNAKPLLPDLLPELVKELPEFILTDKHSVLTDLMQSIINAYQTVLQQLDKTGRSQLLPDLLLDFSSSALKINNYSFAQELVDKSLVTWLNLRKLSIQVEDNKLEKMESVLEFGDVNYLTKLSNYYLSTTNEIASNTVGRLLLIASEKKKKFQVTGDYSNDNARFKIYKKKFQLVGSADE